MSDRAPAAAVAARPGGAGAAAGVVVDDRPGLTHLSGRIGPVAVLNPAKAQRPRATSARIAW